MHFEIFTDEAGLNKFSKRGKNDCIVDSQGQGEADLWGDVHFVIPKGTLYRLQEPDPSKPDGIMFLTRTTHATLCVSVAYSRAPSPTAAVAANGNRLLTTYLESGEQIGQRSDPNFEYEIHKLAQKRFPQHISAGYELIRFGRVIGPDSLPPTASNWQLLPLGYGRQGWVDLNQPTIKKLSDADFPYWHWRHIEEPAATAHDGKCEPATLLNLLKLKQKVPRLTANPSAHSM